MGAINQVFKPNLVWKYTRITVYRNLPRCTLSYDSKTLTICKQDKTGITEAEKEFITRTAGYTPVDYKRNLDVMS
jgi:hypothetical protein